MKRSMFVLFALCGLLWPSAGHSQEPDSTPGTDPNLRLRYALDNTGGNRDTVFVDWVTVYAKPDLEREEQTDLETGTPATRYWINFGRRIAGQDEFQNVDFFSLAPPVGEYSGGRFYDAHVRRDTLLLELAPGYEYLAGFPAVFPDESEYLGSFSSPVYGGALATLSVDPTFVREDAGATTIEIKAQLRSRGTPNIDIHVTPTLHEENLGLNLLFYLDTPTFVIKRGERSATGQMTLTPIPNNIRGYPELGEEGDTDFKIAIGAQGERHQRAYIRLLDDDSPTTEIELTISDPVISIDGRTTDVTVTGTLNGALLDEAVSFSLGVMPPTTAARDTDFGIRLATLTIPAGQATGTATVRVTPRNQNGGQIWLGAAEHPTIGMGSNRRTIVVKEAAIELTKQPSKVIANIEVLPTRSVREDAGQVNVDLKVVLKDALPVDETVRFEIVEECDQSITGCFSLGDLGDAARREIDYFAQFSSVTIPAGQKEATATLSLEIVDNSTTNKTRFIWMIATLGNSRYTRWISIEDDETPTSTVLSSASPTEIAEDSGQTTITITGTLLGSVLSESLTFGLTSTEDDEVDFGEVAATRDVDYTAVFEPLTIPAGQATGTTTLTITPTPNDGKEQDEVIYIGPVSKVKITENGQEREIQMYRSRILLKDVADAPSVATPTEEAPSSLAFDAPASTILSGTVGQALSQVLPTAQSDPEGALTYRVFNLPDGLTFDATTRTITGTPTTAGQTSIEYYALDEGVSAVLTYTIDIQEKPVVIVELGGIAATPDSIRPRGCRRGGDCYANGFSEESRQGRRCDSLGDRRAYGGQDG